MRLSAIRYPPQIVLFRPDEPAHVTFEEDRIGQSAEDSERRAPGDNVTH